jgi:hypothetical protein
MGGMGKVHRMLATLGLLVACAVADAGADAGAYTDAETDDIYSTCADTSHLQTSPLWVSSGGILLVLLLVLAMFWGMAYVTEEHFIPALTILCEEYKIPDDVAGNTVF